MGAVPQFLFWCATGALILGGALRLGPESLRRARGRPGPLLRSLVVVWLGVPILAILVTKALDVPGLGAVTLLLMAICPGVPLLLAKTRSVRGATSTALVLLMATSVTAPLFIPLWTKILSAVSPYDLVLRPRQAFSALLPTVFAPLLLGFAVRAISPRAATALARVTDILFIAGLAFLLILAVIKSAPLLAGIALRTLVAAVLIELGAALMGYWAGGPDTEDRKATSLAAAMGNPALALAVVQASYPGYEAGALLATYALVRAIILFPLTRWLKPRH
jgi:bile acid:Na+ symporter, BASS family